MRGTGIIDSSVVYPLLVLAALALGGGVFYMMFSDSARRAWVMTKLSVGILRKHPFLAAYPVLAMATLLLIMAPILTPIVLRANRDGLFRGTYTKTDLFEPFFRMRPIQEQWDMRGRAHGIPIIIHWPAALGVGIPCYFLLTFAVVFFNVALLISARRIMKGEAATFMEGLRGAWEKRRAIASWAASYAVVKAALFLIERWLARFPKSVWARRLQNIIGVTQEALELAIFLLLPVLAVEGSGVRATLSRAVSLFKKTWGEAIAGIGVNAVVFFISLVPMLFIFAAMGRVSSTLIALLFAVWGVWLLFITLANEAVSMIFRMALYHFATEGTIPAPFAPAQELWPRRLQ